jgi:hypothetical protein
MSYLAIDTFDNTFTTVDIGMRVTSLAMITNIRMHMVKHGTIADGTLTMDILDAGDNVIATKALVYTDFAAVTATYAYGYFNFDFDEQICVNKLTTETYTQVTIRLTMSGHTEDTSNYLALVRQFDNPFITEYGSRPPTGSAESDGWYNPYGVEVYGVKR